jgi:2-phosphoglycerate kinase
MTRRLILIGGSAGTAKTTVAGHLATRLCAGWLQLDTVWMAMRAAHEPGSSAYEALDVNGRLGRGGDTDEAMLAAQIAAAKVVCRALPELVAFELATHHVLVADGAWLLPGCVARLELEDLEDTVVRAVYLHHRDVVGLGRALAPRLDGRPPEERHLRMNRQIWQYGDWLAGQAHAQGYPLVDPLPFDTLADRVLDLLDA